MWRAVQQGHYDMMPKLPVVSEVHSEVEGAKGLGSDCRERMKGRLRMRRRKGYKVGHLEE
jgi:hypothetical protein